MNPVDLEKVLRETLAEFNSETGTIHRLDAQTQLLHLVAQAGLPPPMPIALSDPHSRLTRLAA